MIPPPPPAENRQPLIAFVDHCQRIVGSVPIMDPSLATAAARDAIEQLPDSLPMPEGLIAAGLIAHMLLAGPIRSAGTQASTSGARPIAKSHLRELVDILAVSVPRVPPEQARPPVLHAGVRRALEVVAEHFHDATLSLARVARSAGISPCHLARILKRDTGRVFLWHLHSARIEAAKSLLETTDRSVKEVAALVGYTDATQLCRHFRRRSGNSPLSFRRARARLA